MWNQQDLIEEDKYLTVPNIQQIQEFLEHQVSCKTEKRTLLCSVRYSVSQVDSLSTGEIPKATQLPPQSRQLIRQKPVFTDSTTGPKIKEPIIGDNFPRKPSTITTFSFSSEEEWDDENLIQACASPY